MFFIRHISLQSVHSKNSLSEKDAFLVKAPRLHSHCTPHPQGLHFVNLLSHFFTATNGTEAQTQYETATHRCTLATGCLMTETSAQTIAAPPWTLWWDPVWELPKETQATQRAAWTVNITSENRTVRLTVIKAFPISAWVSLQNKNFSKTYNGDFTCEDLKPRRLKDKTETNNSHTSPKFSLLCHSLFSTNPSNANKNTDSQFTLQVVWW